MIGYPVMTARHLKFEKESGIEEGAVEESGD